MARRARSPQNRRGRRPRRIEPAGVAPAQPAAPPAAPRGTALRDEDLREGRVSLERWEPDLAYRWDAGVAISRFLEGLRAGTILGVRCDACGRTVTPPRAFCEWCFKPMDAWVDLPHTGTVNTFSICYVTWDMQRLDVPQVPAVIEIDRTSPRVGFLHLLGNLAGRTVEELLRQLRVGLPVRAVWKPAAERTGAITDIRYFEPA